MDIKLEQIICKKDKKKYTIYTLANETSALIVYKHNNTETKLIITRQEYETIEDLCKYLNLGKTIYRYNFIK